MGSAHREAERSALARCFVGARRRISSQGVAESGDRAKRSQQTMGTELAASQQLRATNAMNGRAVAFLVLVLVGLGAH
jgi:hypothetical protein